MQFIQCNFPLAYKVKLIRIFIWLDEKQPINYKLMKLEKISYIC